MITLAHVGSGVFEPLQVLPFAIAAGAYSVRFRTLAERGTPVPAWRALIFAGGIALIVVSLVAPIAHIGEELVVGHMVQHLILMDVAAVMIVLGLTGPLLQPLLAKRWLSWMQHLTHPAVALPLWIIVLYTWHAPPLYQGALNNELVHGLEHAMFVGAGIAMWMALIGPLPKPSWFGNGAQLIYVGVVRLAGAALGNAFMWSGTVLYPDYAPGQAYWGIDPLADQGWAGIVMMFESTIIIGISITLLFFRWGRQDTERQRLLDLAYESGIELDEARAARAVAAGQGARLEERLRAGAEGGAKPA